jgi:hypothetical protein
MRAQWIGALWGGVIVLVAAIAGFYVYSLSAKDAPAVIPPTTIQAMILDAQFKGPLKDTVVQRWKDPQTGAFCYIYLPVIVQHSPQTPTGYVQYGANGIGSISCLPHR